MTVMTSVLALSSLLSSKVCYVNSDLIQGEIKIMRDSEALSTLATNSATIVASVDRALRTGHYFFQFVNLLFIFVQVTGILD